MTGSRWSICAVILLVGCGQTPPPAAPSTGARQVAEMFADAVAKRDWPAAYATLHPTTRANLSAEAFARRGAAYLRGIGFVPGKARVRFCEERGEEATAHVAFVHPSHGARGQYRDGWTLRRVDGRWFIVLPANFGGR